MNRIHLVAILLAFLVIACGGTDSQLRGEGETAPADVGGKSEIGANIDRYLSAMESLGFSGAIIVTHGGEVVLREGYGLADRETRRRYTPTTVQTHGSITKQMTGAAIRCSGRQAGHHRPPTPDPFLRPHGGRRPGRRAH